MQAVRKASISGRQILKQPIKQFAKQILKLSGVLRRKVARLCEAKFRLILEDSRQRILFDCVKQIWDQ